MRFWEWLTGGKLPKCPICSRELLNMQDGTYHCDNCYQLFTGE